MKRYLVLFSVTIALFIIPLKVSVEASDTVFFSPEIAAAIFAREHTPDPLANNASEFVYYGGYAFYVKGSQLYRLDLNTKEILILDDACEDEFAFEFDRQIYVYKNRVYYQMYRHVETEIYVIDTDGENKKYIANGNIDYFDAVRGVFFSHTWEGGVATHVGFLNSGEADIFHMENSHFQILNISDNAIVYYYNNVDDSTISIYSISKNSLKPILIAEHHSNYNDELDLNIYNTVAQAEIADNTLFYCAGSYQGTGHFWYGNLFKAKLNGSGSEMIAKGTSDKFLIKDNNLYSSYDYVDMDNFNFKVSLSGGEPQETFYSVFHYLSANDWIYSENYDTDRIILQKSKFDISKDNAEVIVNIPVEKDKTQYIGNITVFNDWVYFVIHSKEYTPNYGWRGHYLGWQLYRVKTDGTELMLLDKELVVTVSVNGENIVFDAFVDPFIENGRTLVPLRAMFEALGTEVIWDDETKTIRALKDKTLIVLQIGNTEMLITPNTTTPATIYTVTLEVPPRIVSDRTFVPLRAVSETFGTNVYWNEDNQTVVITNENISITP